MSRRTRTIVAFICGLLSVIPSCTSVSNHSSVRSGHLLIIGGGLDDDVRSIYERFLKLASAQGEPRILLALTATQEGYDERSELTGKTGALQAWTPSPRVEVIRRETPTTEAVASIDRATGILFTGGDQARITGRYRPAGKETPEWLALRRLLARGGVIAGCSAGDTMMGEFMVLGGDNSIALGGRANKSKGAIAPFQTGPGMAFLPWAVTESHFFERDRVARLVATLEKSGQRLGIGVGEDAAVEVNLASGVVTGVSESDSLLVDVGSLQRDGQVRRNVRARLIRQGDRVSLRDRLTTLPASPAPKPASPAQTVRIASPSQNRQLALWRLFMGASRPGSGVWEVYFDEGWLLTAWPDRDGWVIFDVSPAPIRP